MRWKVASCGTTYKNENLDLSMCWCGFYEGIRLSFALNLDLGKIHLSHKRNWSVSEKIHLSQKRKDSSVSEKIFYGTSLRDVGTFGKIRATVAYQKPLNFRVELCGTNLRTIRYAHTDTHASRLDLGKIHLSQKRNWSVSEKIHLSQKRFIYLRKNLLWYVPTGR
jgi:hypothetical protein